MGVVLSPILEEKLSSFTAENDIRGGLGVCHLYYDIIFLQSWLVECFYHERMSNSGKFRFCIH